MKPRGLSTPEDRAEALRTAEMLAEAARAATLRHFRSPALTVADKGGEGAYDPVTVADREAEAAMRAILADRHPHDAVHGEEHGESAGTSGRRWVLDPIDGTRAYLAGLPTWGVLIALGVPGGPVLGVMDQPFTRERLCGVTWDGEQRTLWQRDGEERLLRTRERSLDDAVLLTTAPEAFAGPDDLRAFGNVARRARLTRFGTDCYGYAVVAMGQADLVIESGLKPYDIQAMIPIVEGAGGVVTNWQGGDCQEGGQVVAAGSHALHDQALEILASAA